MVFHVFKRVKEKYINVNTRMNTAYTWIKKNAKLYKYSHVTFSLKKKVIWFHKINDKIINVWNVYRVSYWGDKYSVQFPERSF